MTKNFSASLSFPGNRKNHVRPQMTSIVNAMHKPQRFYLLRRYLYLLSSTIHVSVPGNRGALQAGHLRPVYSP